MKKTVVVKIFLLMLLPLGLHGVSLAQVPMAEVGEVDFPISCNEAAQTQFNQGLALFHHMTFDGARAAFETATEGPPRWRWRSRVSP